MTELVFGIDLVEWMVSLAARRPPAGLYDLPNPKGVAIEVRLCSEEPVRDFCPSTGTLFEVAFPSDVRVDSWISSGTHVSPYYDSLDRKSVV